MVSIDTPVIISSVVVVIVVFASAVIMGNDSVAGGSGPIKGGDDHLSGLDLATESGDLPGELAIGASMDVPLVQGTRIIKSVNATLTWVDESERPGMPRLRRYENLPDTFQLELVETDGNATSQTGQNPQNGEGQLTISRTLAEGELNSIIDTVLLEDGNRTISDLVLRVTLTDAGNWRTLLPPHVIGFRDDGNSFMLEWDVQYYDLSESVLGND